MNLIAAIIAAADGATIVSNVGRTYKPADLAPIVRIGNRAISYRSVRVTESERKGTWTIREVYS
jgi:hypothetical protein